MPSVLGSSITDRLGRPDRQSPSGFINTAAATNNVEANISGVSWPAVFAGAFVAAALSLSLLALGTGLGFSAVSPWSGDGISASTASAAGIVWLIAMQIIAAAMGGYLAGRLRTKWTGVHNDEVFFRDTAHGFLVWAVGLVITASLLASAASALIGGVSKAATAGVAGVATGMGSASMLAAAAPKSSTGAEPGNAEFSGVSAYFVDGLFRSNAPSNTAAFANPSEAINVANNSAANVTTRAEAARILANGVTDMPVADKTYLSQLIAAKTGISPAEAEKRVTDLQSQIKAKETAAREAADTARKAAMKLSLWVFLGLLIGAFCASFAATIGGKQRDHVAAF